MDILTRQRLLEINKQFYQTFAGQFSSTRRRLQPGVRAVIKELDPAWNLLDVGCGNGELALELHRRGHTGVYVGVDNSPGLLEQARALLPPQAAGQYMFIQGDIASPDWGIFLSSQPIPGQFEAVLAFSVLHHLPGRDLRQQVIQNLAARIRPGGLFIHSNWQFLNSRRLRQRIQPWERIDIDPAQLETNDYLLDWRQGGEGLRYVHHFDPQELASLARLAGFAVLKSFESDGEGGRLGLYQVWQREAGEA